MMAGISTAIADLKRAIIVALTAAAFAAPLSSARASELTALPDASLCNVILSTDRAAIDQSPHWAAHRTEAARRGLDLAACRAALGFPREVPTLLINLDDRTLCEGALDKERGGWEESPVWRRHRDEAARRGLDLAACRVAIGLKSSPEPAIRSATNAWLCSILMNASRTGFDDLPAGAPARVEAERRKLDFAACRVALGLPAAAADALRDATDRSLCSLILNASRTGFDNSPTWALSRAEAERRKLDLAACRVALGLPAQLTDAETAAFGNQMERENCKTALNAERTAFSNAAEARAARAALEKAGRTARDCRKRLDIHLWPVTAMVVAVEQNRKVTVRLLAVAEIRCQALVARLDKAIEGKRPLRESIAADGETADLTVMQQQQLPLASWLLTQAFGLPGEPAEATAEAEGRIRAVVCVTPGQVTYAPMDARPADRELSARIERVNASEISLKGHLGLWQFPDVVNSILASDAPRRLAIDSDGGQAQVALMLADILNSADVELVVRKGANCNSACAVLAALANGRAVVSRKASVGVHRAFEIRNGKPTHEGLEEGNRFLAEALRSAGVTDAFIERMNNQRTFDRMAPVREKDAKTFGLQWRWTD